MYDALLAIIEHAKKDDLNNLERTILKKDSDKIFYEDKCLFEKKEELETIKQEIHYKINLNLDASSLFSKYDEKFRTILYYTNTKCLMGLQLCNARLPRRTNDWIELNFSSIDEERIFIKFDLVALKQHDNLYDLLFHYYLDFEVLDKISGANVMITDASGAAALIKGNLYSFDEIKWENIHSNIMKQINRE